MPIPIIRPNFEFWPRQFQVKLCSMAYNFIEDVNIMLTRQSNIDLLCSKTWGKRGIHYLSLVVRKPAFCICENKDADQLHSNCCAFVFAIRIVPSLYFLNPKFQASSHLVWLHSPVCVEPGRKLRRPIFSERGSFVSYVCSRHSCRYCTHASIHNLCLEQK